MRFSRSQIVLLSFFFLAFLACSSTPKHRSIGEVIDDSFITNKLKVKYMKSKLVKAHQINVDTWKGVVSLKGAVESQEQIDRAIEIAERQYGVKEVKSYLVVKSGEAASVKESRSSKTESPAPSKKSSPPSSKARSVPNHVDDPDLEEEDLTGESKIK